MKLLIGINVLGCILISCSDPVCQPDESLQIVFEDSLDRNLLSYSTPNHYFRGDIKTYTYTSKVKKLYLNISNSSWGPLLFPDDPADGLRIIFASKTMLLQLSPTVTDTITCTQSGGCPLVIDKAWYNSQLVYDRATKFQSPVVIVK